MLIRLQIIKRSVFSGQDQKQVRVMKRATKASKRPNKKARRQATPKLTSEKTPPTRRDLFRTFRNGGIAAALLGGGGWLVVRDVQATIAEHDLSRIGNGIPTIVQIHDPQCSQCIQLQKNTRSALEGFPDNDLQFLVANIKDARGRRLATEHSVGHVTLILFDADGKRRDILRGPSTIQSLEERFRRFHKATHRN